MAQPTSLEIASASNQSIIPSSASRLRIEMGVSSRMFETSPIRRPCRRIRSTNCSEPGVRCTGICATTRSSSNSRAPTSTRMPTCFPSHAAAKRGLHAVPSTTCRRRSRLSAFELVRTSAELAPAARRQSLQTRSLRRRKSARSWGRWYHKVYQRSNVTASTTGLHPDRDRSVLNADRGAGPTPMPGDGVNGWRILRASFAGRLGDVPRRR